MANPKPGQPKTKTLRVKAQTADAVAEIAEATGRAQWDVVEELVGASLPGWHKAVQPQLRKVRELAARLQSAQEEARRAGG